MFLKLAGCDWIREHRHCLLTGPCGVGKSWLACALGYKACRENLSVLYQRVPRLFAQHQERARDVVRPNHEDVNEEDDGERRQSLPLFQPLTLLGLTLSLSKGDQRSDSLTARNTASYILGVTTPVFVFCRDG